MKKITIKLDKGLHHWINILASQQMQTKESFCELLIRNYVADAISGECEQGGEDIEIEDEEMVVQGFKKE